MDGFSRRTFLEVLSSAYLAMLAGCRKKTDWFGEELVCIHIFNPQEQLPAPLLQQPARSARRAFNRGHFSVGLPELVLCTTRKRFLDLFPYFWPFSQSDLSQLEDSIEILYHKDVLSDDADVADFVDYVSTHPSHLTRPGCSAAVILTFHDFTRELLPAVVSACRQAQIAELVVFKDPSRAPYLCEYPARQKGFKRPPP